MIERNFVYPSAPLPELGAAAFLSIFGDRLNSTPVSFDGILALVPTRAAAKNLRNAIFAQAVKLGVSVFGGLSVSTVEDALADYSDNSEITDTESKALWLKVLGDFDLGSLSSLFPFASPKRRDFINVADELSRLQNALGDNLMSVADAAEVLADTPDAFRWRDLSALEAEFEKRAAAIGKTTRAAALKRALENFPAERYDALAIFGNPDVSATLKALSQRFESAGAKVLLTVFAADKTLFDEFGAPLADAYSKIDIGLSDSQIKIFSDVGEEARAVAELAVQFKTNANRAISVSCEQTENVKIFVDVMNGAGVNAVSLEGKTLAKSTAADFLRKLKAYAADGSCATFSNLAGNPAVAADFSALSGKSTDEILADCDFLFSQTCSSSVAQAVGAMEKRIRFGSKDTGAERFRSKKYLEDVFSRADELCAAMSSDSATAAKTVERIFLSGENMTAVDVRERRAQEVSEETFVEIARAELETGARFSPGERFDIVLKHLAAVSDPPDFGGERFPLQDWMEIFWSENPQLVLCDMNDGIVPLANADGMFLNDAVRRKLGLRSQQSRRARDAYMLETLLKSRASEGRSATVCVPRRSADGDPLTPSRILFQCANLPARVGALFAEVPVSKTAPHVEPEWKLRAVRKPFSRRLSASAFNAYLNSPWVFYTDYVLGMESTDSSKRELDASEFGDMFHRTMKRFASSPLRDSDDADEIAAYLETEFDALAEILYGKNPRVQLRLQFASLRQRLRACARVQAQHRRDGWLVREAEMEFSVQFGGVPVRGFFDRVDVRGSETLVIDYKTFEKNYDGIAEDMHVKISKNAENVEWLNLQLPIYYAAAAALYPDTSVSCAYFVAPKDSDGAGFDFWTDIADFIPSAEEKVSDIAKKIAQMCYEPSETPRHDSTPETFAVGFDTLKKIVEFDK